MNKYILGSFLAALAFFLWGYLYWAVSPLPKSIIHTSPDGDAAGAMLKQMFPNDGMYTVPGMSLDEETRHAHHEAGPIATVHIKHAGAPAMTAKYFIVGFAHCWVSALLLTFLLVKASPAVLASYGSRVWFVTLTGVAIAVVSDFSFPVYWGHPWPVYILNAVHIIGGVLVTGLVLAKFVKPAQT
ncbi:MAG TPA: hypothetical protein VMM36_07775, partial [Opitutaceae bacterium]|nr:hypothetical protein [Opitutaceae bacterium]